MLWLTLCSFVTSLRLGAGAVTTAEAAKWALAESSVFDRQSEALKPCGISMLSLDIWNGTHEICAYYTITITLINSL